MNVVNEVWGLFICTTLILATCYWSIKIGYSFGVGHRMSLIIVLWHTLFSVAYYFFTINYGADASFYYEAAASGDLRIGVGTPGVVFLTGIFVYALNLPMFGAFLMHNFMGVLGLIVLHGAIKRECLNESRNIKLLAVAVVFLPSLSFWTAGIGKDAISFLAASLCLWSITDIRSRAKLFITGVLMMLLVRPHVAAMMVLAFLLATIIDSKVSLIKKIPMAVALSAISGFALVFAYQYAGVGDEISAANTIEYIESRQELYIDTGSGMDLSSMNILEVLFAYMYRPIFFEARNALQFISSIENLVLLIGTIIFILKLRMARLKKILQRTSWMLLLYPVMSWILLGLTTGNLGIAVRQKWMFLPFLLYLYIAALSKNNNLNRRQMN